MMFALVSCSSTRMTISDDVFYNFNNYRINEAVSFEKSVHAKDITPQYLVSIGEDIYPNVKKHKLSTPKTFKRRQGKFEIESEFFYTEPDSLIKVVLYEWNRPTTNTTYQNYDQAIKPPIRNIEPNQKQLKDFQNKFDELKRELDKNIGEPYEIELQQGKIRKTSFRDGFKWKRKDGLHAYLFMLGENSNGFRQIRLAIYSE